MKSSQITLGLIARVLASIFLISYLLIAIATEIISSTQLAAILSTIASITIAAGLSLYLWKRQPSTKARYAFASFTANASMTFCLAGNLVLSNQITAIHAVGALMTIWYGFRARARYIQLIDLTYLDRFEPKPKLPSPWAVLKEARR